MQANFDRVLNEFTLEWEGRVYEDVPGDPGGPTKWGITWNDANTWRTAHELPALAHPTDVRDLPETEIIAIYRDHYWTPLRGDDLPCGVDAATFDTAVHVGADRAARWLQTLTGVAADGRIGPKTLAAVQTDAGTHGSLPLAFALLTRRDTYYERIADSNPALQRFLAGWLHRTRALRSYLRERSSGTN